MLCVYKLSLGANYTSQMMPQWVRENSDAFDTGSEILDQVLLVLLETSMFVAGLIGFILDNTIPGNAIANAIAFVML